MSCLFCNQNNYVWENNQYYVLNDIKPELTHHLLIIPKKHIEVFDVETWTGAFHVANELIHRYGFKSYTLKANFHKPRQQIPHAHLHLLAL